MKFTQCRFNFDATSCHWLYVDATLSKRRVPAGQYSRKFRGSPKTFATNISTTSSCPSKKSNFWNIARYRNTGYSLALCSCSLPSGHMTFIQRRLNVNATSWRCVDVQAKLYKRHVPAWSYLEPLHNQQEHNSRTSNPGFPLKRFSHHFSVRCAKKHMSGFFYYYYLLSSCV